LGVIAEVISTYALVTKSQNLLMAFSKLVDFIQIPDCEDNTSTSKSVLINAMNEEKSESTASKSMGCWYEGESKGWVCRRLHAMR
jgi:hypothetical protein